MSSNAVNESITIEEENEEDVVKQNSSFGDGIKELGNSIFLKYPEKTTNISHRNADGITRAEVLNEYMLRNFGYEYKALKTLCQSKRTNTTSVKGYGLEKFIESIKSIQASFEQTQLPERLGGLLRR